MSRISLYIPSPDDYWYEQKLEEDPETMSYNAGYDVSYAGYHYDSGCIDFPKECWKTAYDRRVRENRYFAYIRDEEKDCFVGYVNYQYDQEKERYECGIVIEGKYRHRGYSKDALKLLCDTARENGVKELYDEFEADRDHVPDLFLSQGFEIVEEKQWPKFRKNVKGITVRKIL